MIRPSACRALARAVRQSLLAALPYVVFLGSVVRFSVHPYRDVMVLGLGWYCCVYSQGNDVEREKVNGATGLDARKTHEGKGRNEDKDNTCVPRKAATSGSDSNSDTKHTTSTQISKGKAASPSPTKEDETSALSKAHSVASLPNLPLVIATELLSSYLHPRDITLLACASKACRKIADDNTIWLSLWYQDYGNTLLKWQIGRKAICNSLDLSESTSAKQLQSAISRKLLNDRNVKEFYFVFGQAYLNYLLAGHNDPTKPGRCLVGLHGHIFDFGSFAPYHPGLIDGILRDCGQDATAAFETVRHSRAARRLARLNCLMIDRRCVEKDVNFDLELRQKQLLLYAEEFQHFHSFRMGS